VGAVASVLLLHDRVTGLAVAEEPSRCWVLCSRRVETRRTPNRPTRQLV
jgi:hypothetical protein